MNAIPIPENLDALTPEDLQALHDQIMARGQELANGEDSTDEAVVAELESLGQALDRIEATQTQQAQVNAELTERRDTAASRFQAPAEETAEVVETDDEDDEVDDENAEVVVPDDASSLESVVPAAASTTPAAATIGLPDVGSNVGQQLTARRPKAAKPKPTVDKTRAFMTATALAHGVNEGTPFEDPMAVAAAIAEKRNRFGHIPAGVQDDYISVAQATKETTQYEGESLMVGGDPEQNFGIFRRAQQATTALVASGPVCAPLSPSYEFFRLAEAQSPVQQGLPSVQAPRGGIRYIVPPNVSAAAGAIDISAQDRDYAEGQDGPKNCIRVTCPGTADALVQAVSQCVLFDNLNYKVFPEQVAAFMEDVTVQFESTKEVFLLDYINSQSTAVTSAFSYGLSRSLLYDWTTAVASYRKRHGMRRDSTMSVYAPDWSIDAIKLDLAMQEHNENFWAISDDEAQAALRNRGIQPVWYNDNPTGVTPSQKWNGAQSAGALNAWPTKVTAFLFAPGTFVQLDGATLDVGLVRDSTLNRTNDLQLFMEEWIGAAKLGFESIKLTSTVCINGAAPAGVTARSC